MDAPVPVIKIWKSSTVYYEVENVVTLPVIDRQENRAGSFTFAVTYDATVGTILDSDFAGWSDESEGAVDWGMRVTIDNVADNVETRVAEGIISTITPTEHLLSFECADMLAVLGAKGAELHRNYYNSVTYTGWFNAVSGEGEGDSTVAVDISAISNAEGTPIDPISYRAKINKNWTHNEWWTIYWKHSYPTSDERNEIKWVVTTGEFSQITLEFYLQGTGGYMDCYLDITGPQGSIVSGQLCVVSNNRRVQNLFVYEDQIYPAGTYTIRLYDPTLISAFVDDPITRVGVYACMGSSSDGYIVRNNSEQLGSGAMAISMTTYETKSVTAWTRNGNRLLITGITGVTIDSTTKPDLISPAANRANIPYTSGSIQTTEIMDHIKKVALDDNDSAVIDSSVFGNAPSLSLFRTGGGYALDYIKKLADVSTSSGRQLSFAMDDNVLRIGARRLLTDAESYSVTGGSLTGPLYLIDINLKKTMKGRPSRVMVRGSLSSKTDNKPIMAVLRNASLASRRNGILTDTVITNSSALTAPDMIAEAYAQINDNGEDWEGEIILSGIVPDLIDLSGAYAGSGKVISVTDVHHGLTSKKFKVTAVKMDYVKLTTTVTLTNARQIYSSDIAESIAEALTAGDMSVSSSGSDLYKTQFCYQYSSNAETTLASGNVVKIKTSDNVEYTLGDVAVYLLPNGRKLIYGAISITGSSSNAKYRVKYYQINGGTWREIPERDRCDAYNGQYVILNVDYPQ